MRSVKCPLRESDQCMVDIQPARDPVLERLSQSYGVFAHLTIVHRLPDAAAIELCQLRGYANA